MTGLIANIIEAKIFGFIKTSDGEEFFFHKDDYEADWSQLVEDFRQYGKMRIEVDFRVTNTPKGYRARNVVKAIPNAEPRFCQCKMGNRISNETMHEWLRRVMCMNHWMQTDFYKEMGNSK